jgi:AGCS family alanine or glycine:cation symporter
MCLQSFLSYLNECFTLLLVLPGILLLGLYLSFKLRFPQLTKLKLSAKSLLSTDQKEQGNISHYQALSAVIAGNLGTGNISGMAVALSTGGPGALIWMWVMAFLGATIQFVSCVLGVKYREQDASGNFIGGPMYYLQKGLGFKKIAMVFSFFTLIAAVTVGNFAQINSIVLPLQSVGVNPLLCGIVVAVIVAVVTLGGIKRLAAVSSSVVPVMALIYLLAALIILALNAQHVLPSFKRMFVAAFNFKAATGGVVGFGVLKALNVGFKRGIFATDAGTGIVPILQSSARTKNPVIDGVVTLISPFLVMIMCTTTGLILMVTGAFDHSGLQSTNMVMYAFSKVFGSHFGSFLVITSIFLFAYTTVIAWGCCGERAAEFLWGKKSAKWFQYIYFLLVPIGAVAKVDLVWVLADISISLMLLTNLIGVAGLSKEVIVDTHTFFGVRGKSKLSQEVKG